MIALLLATALAVEKPMEIEMRALPGLAPMGLRIGCMTMVSGHTLDGPKGFGGYSGMHLDTEAGVLNLISDRDAILTLDLTLADDGRVQSIDNAVNRTIISKNKRRVRQDSEALVLDGDAYIVSRESLKDLTRVTRDEGHWRAEGRILDVSFIEPLPPNAGVEAMTRIGDGRILMMPESVNGDGEAAIVAWDGETTEIVNFYQTPPEFRVTDAVADPDTDRLFVVERAFSRAKGPRARITVSSINAILSEPYPPPIEPQLLGRMTFLDGADNMEGIAFFRSRKGDDHLLLISDDNFNAVQRTVLLSMRLNKSCPMMSAAEPANRPDDAPERPINQQKDR